MANKDLIKRAFSVTANLPSASAPTVAALPSAQRDDVEVATPETVPAPPRTPPPIEAAKGPQPKTGPGSMLAFMTEQSEVHREVVKLRERLADFEDAETARRLDPKLIVASKWANRDEAHFSTEAFARLKQEIASAGGNIQPIKVRPLASIPTGEGQARWEVVYGHRRHRACLELGIPVLALIQGEMKDAELFVEMERENREREDLSAWEQGVMYMRALEMGLFPSAKQLAAAIDRDMSNISRAMALAKLPGEVVRAFGSPLNLQFRWATPLKDAHQRDPEGLLARARSVIEDDAKKRSPAEVFTALTAQASPMNTSAAAKHEWKDAKGRTIASMSLDAKGKTSLLFEVPLDESQRRKLIKLVDGFLAART
ncbi:Chromosome partitioning protein ParB [Burkholderiales bacterium 8X]|nr:Chromosome partitioning protein ParB [Burkholderiales bacterium 8X]